MMTESEQVFERYVEEQNLGWTRFPTASGRHPDYKVQYEHSACLFEVKEFDDPAIKPTGGFSPCPGICEKISQARKQFKPYRDHSCSLVLWNSKSIYRNVSLDAVGAAAFGKFVRVDTLSGTGLPADAPSYQFFGAAELTARQNTTISAIVILCPYRLNHLWLYVWRELDAKQRRGEDITPADQFDLLEQLSSERPITYSYDGTIRTIALENPYARIPLPTDLFRGPFDQRWRMESGSFRVTFIGSELERLKQSGVPFIYL
jgi:hypothetical protein